MAHGQGCFQVKHLDSGCVVLGSQALGFGVFLKVWADLGLLGFSCGFFAVGFRLVKCNVSRSRVLGSGFLVFSALGFFQGLVLFSDLALLNRS